MNSNAKLVDYSDITGSFVILSQKGQLFALNRISISTHFSKLAPRINSASFHVVYPLVSKIKLSNIVLVIHPGQRSQTYFLMDIKTGPLKNSVKVFQETVDIIGSALEDDVFPIIHLGELQKAALQGHKNEAPLSVPIRYIELRETLPLTLSASVKDLFLANAEAKTTDETHALEDKLKFSKSEIDFSPFKPNDAHASSIIDSLEKNEAGRFVTSDEFANVIPTLVKQLPWTAPYLTYLR